MRRDPLEIATRPNLWCFFLSLALITLPGCHRQTHGDYDPVSAQTSPPVSTPTGSPEIEKSVKDLIIDWPFIPKEKRAGMLRTWSRVPNGANYRVAERRDFVKPFMTSDYGELAGAYGLATLIVDKTITDRRRMSLIVFIERPGNRSDLYWIYRDQDLSKYEMSRASGDILVNEAHEDGGTSVCEIQWVKDQRKWTCKAW